MQKERQIAIAIVAACAASCDKAPGDRAADRLLHGEHPVNTVSLSIRSPRETMVEGGLVSILVYGRPMPVGHDGLWRDGTKATASLQITERSLADWARRLGSLDLLEGEYTSTYSIGNTAQRGPKPHGVPIKEYLNSHADSAGIDIRSTAMVGGWNVSRWIFVPWKECTPALFARIEETCGSDDLKALVQSLGRHFELNAAPSGDQATSR